MKKTIVTSVLALSIFAANANNMVSHVSTEPVSVSNNTELILNSSLNPFCKAIMLGKIEVVQQMIQLGEDVNQKSLGKTPAMYAARYNRAEILSLLIDNGADLSIKSDEEKYTAKKFAELSNANEALAVISNVAEKRV